MRTRTLPFTLLALCCSLVAASAAQALGFNGRVADGDGRPAHGVRVSAPRRAFARATRGRGNDFPPPRGTGNRIQRGRASARGPKKLPPGARGFEPYAPRAPSDIRMATGGGTRHFDEFEQTLMRGYDIHDKGKYLEAAEYYARAAKMKPDSFRAFFALGIAYEAAGRFSEAAAYYKTAAGLKPEPPDDPLSHLEAIYGFANSQGAAGQHAEAVPAYQRLIDQLEKKAGLPHSRPLAQLRYNFALSLDALGRRPEAIERFKEAVSIDPDYAEAWYNLGVAYTMTEQYGGAMDAFQRAVLTNPSYASAHYNLGLVYYVTDYGPGLEAHLAVLRKLDPRLADELARLRGK